MRATSADDRSRLLAKYGKKGMSLKEATFVQKNRPVDLPADDLPLDDIQEMPTKQAIRHAIAHRAGSLKLAWAKLDNNGSGSLSMTEFVDGMKTLRIPVTICTGMSENEVFKEFDEDHSGSIELEEFLGYPEALDQDWRNASRVDCWKNYQTKVMMSAPELKRLPRWDVTAMARRR
jgi:Ca2+-binding EF-hand superfamily protein